MFYKLEPIIQVEIINAAATSVNFSLLENFQRLLAETEVRAARESSDFLFDLADQIRDGI